MKLTTSLLVGLLLVGCATVEAQTGIVIPMPKAYFADSDGDGPCAGCKLFSYQAGTTTKQSTYSDVNLGSANTNPLVLGSDGRATIFLNPSQSYKFVLAPPTDSDPPAAAYYTQDNIIGPYSGVFTVSAADPRGLRVTRTSAEAGMSITSSGGAGKSYGILSTTAGELRIQDESDTTPRLALSGDDILAQFSAGTPPSFRVLNGLLNVTGPGQHTIEASNPTGGNVLSVRNTSAGTAAFGGFNVGNDTSISAVGTYALSTTWTTTGIYKQSSGHIGSIVSGGLTLATTHASGNIRFATADVDRHIMTASGLVGFSVGNNTPSNDVEIRSTLDGIGSGGLRVSRADGSYFIMNMDDGGALAQATLQAGDGGTTRPLRLQPSGGGIQVGSSGSTITAVYHGNASYDPPSIANGASTTTSVTVTGATTSSICFAGHTLTSTNALLFSAAASAANQATVTIHNTSGGAVDLANGTIRVTCFTH